MRLISQNRKFDIEYEKCSLLINEHSCEIEEYVLEDFQLVMREYGALGECMKAMKMLRECYIANLMKKYQKSGSDFVREYYNGKKVGVFEFPIRRYV